VIAYEHPRKVASLDSCRAEATRLGRSLAMAVHRGDRRAVKYLYRRLAAVERIGRQYRRHEYDEASA
jgi:hypothetical protein